MKQKTYRVWLKSCDPEIKIQISAVILKEVVERALENGHTVETEVAIRLARTLEAENSIGCKEKT